MKDSIGSMSLNSFLEITSENTTSYILAKLFDDINSVSVNVNFSTKEIIYRN